MLLRVLLIVLFFRPLARFLTGADIVGREHLPIKGPAIVTPNHSSHVDTLLLLALFSARAIPRVRPAAAADYFLSNPIISWFSRRVIGIVPVYRELAATGADVLEPMRAALAAGDILVVYPEGTRGRGNGDLAPLKSGVARLAEAFPNVPVVPVWIQGGRPRSWERRFGPRTPNLLRARRGANALDRRKGPILAGTPKASRRV